MYSILMLPFPHEHTHTISVRLAVQSITPFLHIPAFLIAAQTAFLFMGFDVAEAWCVLLVFLQLTQFGNHTI